MLKIIVFSENKDDTETIRRFVEKKLQLCNVKKYRVVSCYEDEEELIRLAHIIFLDIDMNKKDVNTVVGKIRKHNVQAYLIFISQYLEYVLEGYKLGVTRYILKDSLDSMLQEFLETLLVKEGFIEKKLEYNCRGGRIIMPVSNIKYVESRLHKMIFYMFDKSNKTYEVTGKLEALEEELQEYNFYRVHRSYLVNFSYVSKVSNYQLEMKEGYTIPVSKKRYRDVKAMYNRISDKE